MERIEQVLGLALEPAAAQGVGTDAPNGGDGTMAATPSIASESIIARPGRRPSDV